MDYNDVPLFVRVVESGSFTAAAARLGMQKSSVSRGVARLEESLGVRLLQRTTRKLALTDAGQAFYERVRGAISAVDEAGGAAQEHGNEPRGTVRVTAVPDTDSLRLPYILAEFVAKYPKIHVELVLTTRTVDLVAEGVDLAIRAGRLPDSTLVARRVGSLDIALFAAPSYLERRGRPKTLADLAHHDCVLFRATNGRATLTLTGPRGEESVEVRGRVSADDLAFLSPVISAGAGIGLVTLPHASVAVQRGELELVLPEYRLAGGGIYLVLPSSAFVPARVALLRDFLAERLARFFEEVQQRCAGHEREQRAAPSSHARAPARRARPARETRPRPRKRA